MALDAGSPLADAFDAIADAVITTIAPVVAMEGCSVRLLERVEAAVEAGQLDPPASPTVGATAAPR